MAQTAAYPEPDAGSEAMHPYANQYSVPPSGHSHIPHPAEATMRRDSNGSGHFLQGSEHFAGQAQPATPQQLAQRSLNVNQDSNANDPDSSSRKRSKVSRACDECRRKKVSTPLGSTNIRRNLLTSKDTMRRGVRSTWHNMFFLSTRRNHL